MVSKKKSSRDSERSDSTGNLTLELRRGALVLAVLSQLRVEQYGYSLIQRLTARGLEINEGTLYPLLRRLEAQGLLTSDWQVVEGKRPRRYYRLSGAGEDALRNLGEEWEQLRKVIARLLASSTDSDTPGGKER